MTDDTDDRTTSRCPFCAPDSEECEHVVGMAHTDPVELMDAFGTWSQIDDIVSKIDRWAVDGPATLDGLVRLAKFWWLTRRGEGDGLCERLAKPPAIARRFDLVLQKVTRDDLGLEPQEVLALLAKDRDAAHAHIESVLDHVLAELRILERRFGLAEPQAKNPRRGHR